MPPIGKLASQYFGHWVEGWRWEQLGGLVSIAGSLPVSVRRRRQRRYRYTELPGCRDHSDQVWTHAIRVFDRLHVIFLWRRISGHFPCGRGRQHRSRSRWRRWQSPSSGRSAHCADRWLRSGRRYQNPSIVLTSQRAEQATPRRFDAPSCRILDDRGCQRRSLQARLRLACWAFADILVAECMMPFDELRDNMPGCLTVAVPVVPKSVLAVGRSG